MSTERKPPDSPGGPGGEAQKKDDGRKAPDNADRSLAEEYSKYRQAEREEEQRLERHERTSSTDPKRPTGENK